MAYSLMYRLSRAPSSTWPIFSIRSSPAERMALVFSVSIEPEITPFQLGSPVVSKGTARSSAFRLRRSSFLVSFSAFWLALFPSADTSVWIMGCSGWRKLDAMSARVALVVPSSLSSVFIASP